MNPLERQLATLLKDAAGEPPITLDADTLAASGRPRRRYLAPLIAAAVVLAIAIALGVLLNRGPSPVTVATQKSPSISVKGPQPADPRRTALGTADRIIATAPIPPGAIQRARPPLAELDEPSSTPGAQHVQRTRFWTVRGTLAAAISYLKAHPPYGMRPSGSGRSSGGSAAPSTMLAFQAGEFQTLEYTVVSYNGGVAVRADAQVLWAPTRSPADTVPASISSVEVTITRQNPQAHRGAPTVRRTVTGAPARTLADFVNRLPRAIPTGYVSCPAMLGGEQWSDRLVFHSSGLTATVVVDLAGCASATFQIGDRKAIQLSQTYSGVIGPLDHTILSTLSLPITYGD